MNICKMKRSTQIAIMTGTGSGAVEKTASGTAPLTLSDSVAGNILGITANGRSVVSAGSIVNIGDNGLTVTTANSDSTVTTSAEITTALPLRGVSVTIRDKLICTADVKQVETVCDKVRLADLTWTASSIENIFYTVVPNTSNPIAGGQPAITSKYNQSYSIVTQMGNKTFVFNNSDQSSVKGMLYIKDTDYTTVSDFVASLGDAELVYALATPVTTPLTDAEISAFLGLKTFDPTTTISVTDNPSITVKYMGKRTTRTAPKKRTSRKKKS